MRRNIKRRGTALLALVVILAVTIAAFTSLSVDFGHAQVVKTQLASAADAAARAGATGLKTSSSTASAYAISAAGYNKADGASVVLQSSDIEFGVYDSSTKTFTTMSGVWLPSATSVRVTARRTTATNNPVQLMFARLIGRTTVDVKAVSVASFGKDYNYTIQAIACPWLAGMPNGTHINGSGGGVTAPQNSPLQINIPIVPGTNLNFRNTNGQTGDTSTGKTYGLDGDPTRTTIAQAAANGIPTTKAPLNALMGIFLNDNAPNQGSSPSGLDFSSTNARNFTTLTPGLKQVFFIGDGMDSNNQIQNFVVPTGATRLFLGVMDENAFWSDNVGSISTTMYDGKITLVK